MKHFAAHYTYDLRGRLECFLQLYRVMQEKRTQHVQWFAKLLGTLITQNKYYDFNSNPM